MSHGTYDETWDLTHQATDDHQWQESDCYWFYDVEQQVGGFHRVGQKPNAGTGQISLLAFKVGGKRYSINHAYVRHYAVGPENRWRTGQRVGKHTAESLGSQRMRYTWDEPECSADLEFYESFYTPRNWPGAVAADMGETMTPGHLEGAGRIRGKVRIDDQTYDIDALAHRDRSWGFRDHELWNWHRYRMSSGTVGPELSWASFALDNQDDVLHQGGFVVRNGVEEDIVNVRVLTTMDSDGFTVVGCNSVFTLASGEKLSIPGVVKQAMMTPLPWHGGQLPHLDHITQVEYGGRQGFIDLEMQINPGRGLYMPTKATSTTPVALASGLSPSRTYDLDL